MANKEKIWKIKWNVHSNGHPNKWDNEITFEKEGTAHYEYGKFMKKPYFYVGLFEIVDGREQNLASSCQSELKQEEIQ